MGLPAEGTQVPSTLTRLARQSLTMEEPPGPAGPSWAVLGAGGGGPAWAAVGRRGGGRDLAWAVCQRGGPSMGGGRRDLT